jgi:putative inorganic carbon (hco3(-)) transporter
MLALLKPIIPWVLYAAVLAVALVGMTRHAQRSLYLLVLLTPLPALWYPLHGLPLGKDTMDILVFACIVGAYVNKDGMEAPDGSGVIKFFMLVSLASLINMLVGFGIPLDAAKPFISIWKNYFEMLLLYFISYSILKDEKHQRNLVVLIAFIIFLISLREFRNFTAGSSFSYDKRSSGPFYLLGLGPNHFAAFIAHMGCLVLGLFLLDKDKWRRRLYAVTLLFALHPLFFAYSRGAYAAVVLVLLIYGVLQKRLILIGLLVLAFTWQVVLPETVVDRITMTSNEDGQLEDSALQRVILWEKAKQLFRDNPVFGVGINGFEYEMRGHELRNTHNFFMQTAAEQGVIGLFALALLFIRGYWVAWHVFRSKGDDFQRGLGLGFLGCVTAVIITNIFGDRFSQFAIGGYFFILFGLLERIWASCKSVRPQASTQVKSAPTSGLVTGGISGPRT